MDNLLEKFEFQEILQERIGHLNIYEIETIFKDLTLKNMPNL